MPADDDRNRNDNDPAEDDSGFDFADERDLEDEDAPAWVRGAGVRWFGVAMFLVLGVVAVLVLVATLLAIYDRARDDSPPPAPIVVLAAVEIDPQG